ncbi:MAG TPA: hypothetical protein VG457_01640, partial [Planctomycetota bacterium]|nr:hypothetical protein [Planctomycetota bacterium]
MIGATGLRQAMIALWAAAIALPLGAQDGPPKQGADSYGDPLPPGSSARIGTARMRHGLEISCLEYTPDGLSFATSGLEFDNTAALRLWDAATGRERRAFFPTPDPNGFSSHVYPIAFSPDGKFVAGVSIKIHLWEVASGRDLRQWGDPVRQ